MLEEDRMPQVVFDFPPTVFSALRKAPEEFASEMRLAAAIHWYSQGMISQGKAAEIADVSRVELLEELFRRKIPAVQVTVEELREELLRG
jgi:predicted HTH domain antitoxin